MSNLLRLADDLLRGGAGGREARLRARDSTPLANLIVLGLVLGAIYGAFMGLYGVLRPQSPTVYQWLATTLKVPLLFLLTLLVTFPSLYVFSVLAGSPLRIGGIVRIVLAAIVVNLALLASLGPVTGFFTLSTESYPFMVFLNVVVFAVCGVAGLVYLHAEIRESLSGVSASSRSPPKHEGKGEGDDVPLLVPFEVDARSLVRTRLIFIVWIFIFGTVGAQMSWILRPFVGAPGVQFSLFRPRQSNFFEAVIETLSRLFG